MGIGSVEGKSVSLNSVLRPFPDPLARGWTPWSCPVIYVLFSLSAAMDTPNLFSTSAWTIYNEEQEIQKSVLRIKEFHWGEVEMGVKDPKQSTWETMMPSGSIRTHAYDSHPFLQGNFYEVPIHCFLHFWYCGMKVEDRQCTLLYMCHTKSNIPIVTAKCGLHQAVGRALKTVLMSRWTINLIFLVVG